MSENPNEERAASPDLNPSIIEEEGGTDVYDIDPGDEIISVSYDITSYGADFDVEGLVRRIEKGDIVVPSFDPSSPGIDVRAFQRRFVWRKPQMSKFVESLLLGLPVPGIFLVKDSDNRLLVLDGQQRLMTLMKFYSGRLDDRIFRLSGVQDPFDGLAYDELQPEDRRRLDDSIIHATILRDESESSARTAVYSIYERLNTGGSPLQPQEIRIALYAGNFLHGIAQLNADESWRSIYGPESPRFKDHELILRILALYSEQEHYKSPLKTFLNDYLARHRSEMLTCEAGIGKLFIEAIKQLELLGRDKVRRGRALNMALADALVVAIMRRIASGVFLADNGEEIRQAFAALEADREFTDATSFGTSNEWSVHTRLDRATQAFSGS